MLSESFAYKSQPIILFWQWYQGVMVDPKSLQIYHVLKLYSTQVKSFHAQYRFSFAFHSFSFRSKKHSIISSYNQLLAITYTRTKILDTTNCAHTWNPRQGRRRLTCPQPGALHTKGRSSPIFAKSLQCNCGKGEEENIAAAFSLFVNWQILKTTKQGCCGLSSLVWAGSRMLFKNNPGTEENMHRGSETKFPWWYFLNTRGILAGQWGAAYKRERQLLFIQTHLPLLLYHFPPTSNPSFSHYHSLSSPMKHLPNVCFLVPLIQPCHLSAVSLSTQSLFWWFPSTFWELSCKSTAQISWNGHIHTDPTLYLILLSWLTTT